MKSEKIIDALGNIDDQLILECLPLVQVRPKRRRMPILALAACLTLCMLAAPRIWRWFGAEPRQEQTPQIDEVENSTTWKALDEKIASAADPDRVGGVAKDAFAAYFKTHPDTLAAYGGEDWIWSFFKSNMGDEEVAVLKCDCPLAVSEETSQCFFYSYEQREVSIGPSGTRAEEAPEDAQAIRRILTAWDTEESGISDPREAFSYYYMAHPTELQLLPVFEKDVPPDWNLLSLYILLQTKPDSTFTASAFRGMVEQYLGACTYTDGSSDYMTYENGGYTVDAMDMNLDTVYYRLESLEMLEDGVYQAAFEGFALPYEEIINEGYRNPQTQNMRLLVEQTGLPSDSLEWSDVERRILESTGRASKSLEEQGFEVADRVTVTFRLQDGGNPMQYLSCRRGFRLVAQWGSHWLMENCTREGTEVRLILMPAQKVLDSYWVEMDMEAPNADEFPMDAYLTLDGFDGDLAWGEAGLYRYENGRLAQMYDSGVCAAVQDGGGYLIVTREKGRRVLYTSGGVSFHAGDMVVQIDSKGNSVTLADASDLDLCLTGVYRGNDGSLYVEASENWGMADLHRYLYRVSNGRLIACATEGGNGYSDRSEAEAAAEQERLDAIYEAGEAR